MCGCDVVHVQSVDSVLASVDASEDRLSRFAVRHWSLAAKQLKQVVDRVLIFAEDDGRMTRDAVQRYSTSCMRVIVSDLL